MLVWEFGRLGLITHVIGCGTHFLFPFLFLGVGRSFWVLSMLVGGGDEDVFASKPRCGWMDSCWAPFFFRARESWSRQLLDVGRGVAARWSRERTIRIVSQLYHYGVEVDKGRRGELKWEPLCIPLCFEALMAGRTHVGRWCFACFSRLLLLLEACRPFLLALPWDGSVSEVRLSLLFPIFLITLSSYFVETKRNRQGQKKKLISVLLLLLFSFVVLMGER